MGPNGLLNQLTKNVLETALDAEMTAQRVIEVLADNGRRLDWPWMLAMSARCQAMLLAAQRDVSAAVRAGRTPAAADAVRGCAYAAAAW